MHLLQGSLLHKHSLVKAHTLERELSPGCMMQDAHIPVLPACVLLVPPAAGPAPQGEGHQPAAHHRHAGTPGTASLPTTHAHPGQAFRRPHRSHVMLREVHLQPVRPAIAAASAIAAGDLDNT